MFRRPEKKQKSSVKSLNDLIRITPASSLLSDEKRNALLGEIAEACELESVGFESLCLSLIHNFANHCQTLPEASLNYYSQPGGLLDHALNRTEAALNLFRQYVIREAESEWSEEQKLWQYALFSAAVLQGIGKLYVDYIVDLYDSNGHFLKQWNPLLESPTSLGTYYNYEFQEESDEEFRRRLNLLMARFLMPANGFAWIVSNPQVLAVWLALLNEDPYSAGTLGAILIRADALAIQRYFSQFLKRGQVAGAGRLGRMTTFTDVTPESLSELEQQIGIEFIQWLTKNLEAGRILVNKAPLFLVPGGMLMLPDLFKLFVREYPEYKNWQAIQNGFLSLKLHRLGRDGSPTSRFQINEKMHNGIVFSNYAIALPSEVRYQLNTGKTSTVSALELIYEEQAGNGLKSLPHLNAAGQWQLTNGAPQTSNKPGAKSG